MNRSLLVVSLGLIGAAAVSAADPVPKPAMPEKYQTLLRDHCLKCHDEKKQKGSVRLDDLPFTIGTVETAERWQKVLNVLNANEMPPEGEKPIEARAKADFLDDLANVMVAARRGLSDQGGKFTMRRLNRREYRNTLRELLGVEINVSELPADTGTGGFDTAGSNLFMSSNQFEQYLSLSREALEEAFARQTGATATDIKLRLEGETASARAKEYIEQEFDASARGTKWVAAVMAAAAKPENAKVVAELRKTAKDDAILRRSWKQIEGAPSPESFGFETGENNADKANRAAALTTNHGYFRYYLAQPALDTGTYLTIGQEDRVTSWLTILAPFQWPVGDYVVRARVAAVDGTPAERRFLEFGINPRHGKVASTHHITGTMAKPQLIEIPWTLTREHTDRGDRTIFIREKGTADHIDQTRRRFNDGRKENNVGPTVALWVDYFELEYRPKKLDVPGMNALGIPLDDKSNPSAAELRAALERFAREAFRGRTPEAAYLDRLVGLYELRRKGGDKHRAALVETLSVVLASPMFLYLAEPATDGKSRPLTDLELATRLSYFLWGSPPDATLTKLAASGDLAKPDILAAQVDRLLDDPRSAGFVRPFLSQWLTLDRLDFFEINRAQYPRFDDSVKLAARDEVYETYAHLLKSNGSLRDLLKSDYVVTNAVLADYYGLPNVEGDAFRKVPIPADSPRGGLLGMAAIHVMGGNGEKTSPVERGAWVLRKLLNDPPPPPPANVPQLARLAGKLLTTRERVLAHQEQAQCASCHRKIDPIGFGLENFDAAGQWRTTDSYQVMLDNGKPDPKLKKSWTIEPASAFHNGPAFKDFFELRTIIAGKSDAFARGYSSALAEYALGRPVGFSDEALLDAVRTRAKGKEYAMREFIQALVARKEFQSK